MSAVQDSSLLPPLRPPATWFPPIQVQPPALPAIVPPPLPPPQPFAARAPDQGRVVFTRQLWQRTMPEDPTEHGVSTRSQSQGSIQHPSHPSLSRRASSNISTRSLRSASSPARGSKAPLTPEESPPFRTTRKRNASIVEEEDKRLDATPIHSRVNSGDSASHVCLCQPDPKIPRPRNAFILYRQHHQGKVVAQHPGLANPEISKIIGEQWRNQPTEVKNEWKALAEEEKLRHQQQYPDYRYQPKRNGRRNSLTSETPGSATSEKPRCNKCGGRTILAPASTYTHNSQTTSPPGTSIPPSTPGSAATPVSRTLPILRDLSLQSPAARRIRQYNMSPSHHYYDERDDVESLSPDTKRRRFHGEHPTTVHRVAPPRYGCAPPPGMQVGSGTPFPFGQGPAAPHQYPPIQTPVIAHMRRESLPGLRGMVSTPGVMAPPPRPGMGYQQHRLSQGHIAHDRSLTLAPLQTGNVTQPATPVQKPKSSTSKSMEDVIMELPFHYKLKVLRQIAPPPPLTKTMPRGPLVTIEGENVGAVHELSKWLAETLGKDSDLNVKLLEGPDVSAKGAREDAMAEYHALAATWLGKSKEIVQQLEYTLPVAPSTAASTAMDTSTIGPTATTSALDNDENYSDNFSPQTQPPHSTAMDLDPSTSSSNTNKPILILPLFSLHASNTFACRIPITDPYAPNDHWQWSATQWRGVVGPDLTIYVRDAIEGRAKCVEQSEEEMLFIVRRSKKEDGSDGFEVDGATLRRVGFEVGEWVRGFGGR